MPAYVLRVLGTGPAPDLGEPYSRREVEGYTYVSTDAPTCMRRLMHCGYELSGYAWPEPELEAETAAAHGPDLLDLSARAIERALADGQRDGELLDLLSAETAGKSRKGVLAVLKARLAREEG